MENNQNVYYKVEVDAVVRGWGIESRSDEKTTPQQSRSRFKNEFGFEPCMAQKSLVNGRICRKHRQGSKAPYLLRLPSESLSAAAAAAAPDAPTKSPKVSA